jgi:type III secretory pathway component EscR
MLQPLTEGLLPLHGIPMLLSEEVSHPKTVNIKQYLNTNNFSVSKRHFVIKSSQAIQPYITKIFHKKSSCHGYIKNHFSSEILIKLTFSDSVQSHD